MDFTLLLHGNTNQQIAVHCQIAHRQGSEQVTGVGAPMKQIVTSIGQVTPIVGEIASASEEQSAGIEQVNTAIVELDRATRQNAALVEQAAAAAAKGHPAWRCAR